MELMDPTTAGWVSIITSLIALASAIAAAVGSASKAQVAQLEQALTAQHSTIEGLQDENKRLRQVLNDREGELRELRKRMDEAILARDQRIDELEKESLSLRTQIAELRAELETRKRRQNGRA